MLATVVRVEGPASAQPGDKAVITADGRLQGWIGGSCSEPLVRREALRALAEGAARLVKIVPSDESAFTERGRELTFATTCPSGGALDIFIEPQLPKPLLLVFGETPAALTLARTAELAGFRARAVRRSGLGELRPPGADAWAVVATMGHYDEDALEAVLAFPDVDVALVASRRRAAAVKQALLRRGLGEDAVARVRSPAGRVKGAGQEEIAVLALADVVVRRRSTGRSLPSPPSGLDTIGFATDAVCGMAVEIGERALTVERDGTVHYFCSDGCRETFLATAPA